MATNKHVGANYVSKKNLDKMGASERINNKITMRNDNAIRDLNEAEVAIVKLNRDYEMYFLGLERIYPQKETEELKKRLQRLRADMGGIKTSIKYRANTVWMRFTSYEQMWTRTLKQIEEGTYHRDVAKAKRRAAKAEYEAAHGITPDKPAAAAKPKPSAGENLSDDQIKKIYDTYVMARRRTGESTKVSMQSLATQLRERATTVASKNAVDGVDFKVVIKGGKALIKAVPRE